MKTKKEGIVAFLSCTLCIFVCFDEDYRYLYFNIYTLCVVTAAKGSGDVIIE